MKATDRVDKLIRSYWDNLDNLAKLVKSARKQPNADIRRQLNAQMKALDTKGGQLRAAIEAEIEVLRRLSGK